MRILHVKLLDPITELVSSRSLLREVGCRYFMFLVLCFLIHQWSVGFFRCKPGSQPG